MRGRLDDAAAVRRAMTAGNARLTVVSQRTGARFTYRFRRLAEARCVNPQDFDTIFVSLLRGPDNEGDYSYMGLLADGEYGLHMKRTKKSVIADGTPSDVALKWTLRCVTQGELRGVEVWHEGRCCRCGRTLTVPESVASGLGPECAGRV